MQNFNTTTTKQMRKDDDEESKDDYRDGDISQLFEKAKLQDLLKNNPIQVEFKPFNLNFKTQPTSNFNLKGHSLGGVAQVLMPYAATDAIRVNTSNLRFSRTLNQVASVAVTPTAGVNFKAILVVFTPFSTMNQGWVFVSIDGVNYGFLSTIPKSPELSNYPQYSIQGVTVQVGPDGSVLNNNLLQGSIDAINVQNTPVNLVNFDFDSGGGAIGKPLIQSPLIDGVQVVCPYRYPINYNGTSAATMVSGPVAQISNRQFDNVTCIVTGPQTTLTVTQFSILNTQNPFTTVHTVSRQVYAGGAISTTVFGPQTFFNFQLIPGDVIQQTTLIATGNITLSSMQDSGDNAGLTLIKIINPQPTINIKLQMISWIAMEVATDILSVLGQMNESRVIPEEVYVAAVHMYYKMQKCCDISPIVPLTDADKYTEKILELLQDPERIKIATAGLFDVMKKFYKMARPVAQFVWKKTKDLFDPEYQQAIEGVTNSVDKLVLGSVHDKKIGKAMLTSGGLMQKYDAINSQANTLYGKFMSNESNGGSKRAELIKQFQNVLTQLHIMRNQIQYGLNSEADNRDNLQLMEKKIEILRGYVIGGYADKQQNGVELQTKKIGYAMLHSSHQDKTVAEYIAEAPNGVVQDPQFYLNYCVSDSEDECAPPEVPKFSKKTIKPPVVRPKKGVFKTFDMEKDVLHESDSGSSIVSDFQPSSITMPNDSSEEEQVFYRNGKILPFWQDDAFEDESWNGGKQRYMSYQQRVKLFEDRNEWIKVYAEENNLMMQEVAIKSMHRHLCGSNCQEKTDCHFLNDTLKFGFDEATKMRIEELNQRPKKIGFAMLSEKKKDKKHKSDEGIAETQTGKEETKSMSNAPQSTTVENEEFKTSLTSTEDKLKVDILNKTQKEMTVTVQQQKIGFAMLSRTNNQPPKMEKSKVENEIKEEAKIDVNLVDQWLMSKTSPDDQLDLDYIGLLPVRIQENQQVRYEIKEISITRNRKKEKEKYNRVAAQGGVSVYVDTMFKDYNCVDMLSGENTEDVYITVDADFEIQQESWAIHYLIYQLGIRQTIMASGSYDFKNKTTFAVKMDEDIQEGKVAAMNLFEREVPKILYCSNPSAIVWTVQNPAAVGKVGATSNTDGLAFFALRRGQVVQSIPKSDSVDSQTAIALYHKYKQTLEKEMKDVLGFQTASRLAQLPSQMGMIMSRIKDPNTQSAIAGFKKVLKDVAKYKILDPQQEYSPQQQVPNIAVYSLIVLNVAFLKSSAKLLEACYYNIDEPLPLFCAANLTTLYGPYISYMKGIYANQAKIVIAATLGQLKKMVYTVEEIKTKFKTQKMISLPNLKPIYLNYPEAVGLFKVAKKYLLQLELGSVSLGNVIIQDAEVVESKQKDKQQDQDDLLGGESNYNGQAF